MAFSSDSVEIVANKIFSVFYLLIARLQHNRVRGLDVVIDNVVRQNTAKS